MVHNSAVTQTIIEQLAGIEPDSPVAKNYQRRAVARDQAELSYQLLLHPQTPGSVSLAERRVIAAFVAGLYQEPATQRHYAGLLQNVAPAFVQSLEQILQQASTLGPWGAYPQGPLSVEDVGGTPWHSTPEQAGVFGPRLAAALEHAHLLVTHPRDANPAALARLAAAGWDEDGLVVLSQLIAFLSFQVRIVSGFSVLVATSFAQTTESAHHA
jgi:CMD domain protein